MAEINPTDAIPATNASNTTRYFNLPLFIATDKPSWLVDWNGAMNEIDSILQDINTSASGAESDVETVVTQVNQLSGVVSNLESLVNTAVTDVAEMQTTVDSHEERMDGIETDLITQNNLIKSLSDAVTTMQATVGTLNSRVSAMETTVAGYDSRITSAEQASASASAIATETASSLQTLQGTVNTINSSVSSLNSRVTALENQSYEAMPSVQDLENSAKFTKNSTSFISVNSPMTGSADITLPAGDVYYMLLCEAKVSGSTSDYEITVSCDLPDMLGAKINAFAVGPMQTTNKGMCVTSGILHSNTNSPATNVGAVKWEFTLPSGTPISSTNFGQVTLITYTKVQ